MNECASGVVPKVPKTKSYKGVKTILVAKENSEPSLYFDQHEGLPLMEYSASCI